MGHGHLTRARIMALGGRVRARLVMGAWSLFAACQVLALEANDANQAELEMISGIGPALSEAILAARHERPFSDWQDFIDRMPGIGPTRAHRLSAAGLRIAGQVWPSSSDAR